MEGQTLVTALALSSPCHPTYPMSQFNLTSLRSCLRGEGGFGGGICMNQHSPVALGKAETMLFMVWSRPDQIRFLAVRIWRVNQGIGGFFGTFLGPSQESTAVRVGHGRSKSDWISAFCLSSSAFILSAKNTSSPPKRSHLMPHTESALRTIRRALRVQQEVRECGPYF